MITFWNGDHTSNTNWDCLKNRANEAFRPSDVITKGVNLRGMEVAPLHFL